MNLHLTDSDFFITYCNSAEIVFNSGDNEIYFIKDKDLNFHITSHGYEDYFNPNNIVPRGEAHSVPDATANDEIEKEAFRHDTLIMKNRQPMSYLYIDIYRHVWIVRKRPIINPATGNFVGILGLAKPFMIPNIINLIYRMNNISYGIVNQAVKQPPLAYELTKRQHIVLFLYINRYSYTEVASIMSTLGIKISASRVNDHLENLKYIFVVKTKEQLIEKAINLDYHLFLPRELTRPGFYPIEDKLLVSD